MQNRGKKSAPNGERKGMKKSGGGTG